MDKYQNKFYVGELFVSGPISVANISEPNCEKYKLLKNGAIDLKIGMWSRHIDYDKGIEYSRLFTIFLEDGKSFKCLHNCKNYTENGSYEYCTNLVPLEYLLPIIGCRYNKYLTSEEALYIYSLLFKKGLNQESLFNHYKNLDMNRLFVGNLRLCTGFCPEDLAKDIYKFTNLERKLMLYKSDAALVSIESANKENIDECGAVEGTYDQDVFQTLFLECSGKGFYNLHNFDFYDEIPSVYNNFSFVEDRCGDLKPLQEALEEHKIWCHEKQISVPKALKLYRKLNNK